MCSRSVYCHCALFFMLDAAPFHMVVFIVPAVLLILIFALVALYKYKCSKVQGMSYTKYMHTKLTSKHTQMHINKL